MLVGFVALATAAAGVLRRRARRLRGAFVGYCAAGLEDLAAEEVGAMPTAVVIAVHRPSGTSRAVMGQVIFRIERPELVPGLRSFQSVEALVALADRVPTDKQAGTDYIYVCAPHLRSSSSVNDSILSLSGNEARDGGGVLAGSLRAGTARRSRSVRHRAAHDPCSRGEEW